jgi:hypothetical protein
MINKMKKIIRLTESDLARIVRRVIREEENKLPCDTWEGAIKFIKDNPLGVQGFKFERFVEGIKTNPMVLKHPTIKGELQIEKDNTWNLFDIKGKGTNSGKWSCKSMPGGGTRISLGVDLK